MLCITAVAPGSIAAELDLAAGDRLQAVNGTVVEDLVDYVRLTDDQADLLLEVCKADGSLWELEIERDPDQALGLDFAALEPRRCRNNCPFCFVRQLPEAVRPSLRLRDDDYRFSYLYGAYISLTNLQPADFERIAQQQLSPLYVSVHATDATVRARLLGWAAPPVLPQLQRLAAAGIQLHTQVVLCPGINDGAVLEQTLEDLVTLYPAVASLAVVPVGLTRYRDRLPPLAPVDAALASATLTQIERWQTHCLARWGTRFVFAADEFYLTADRPLPELACYEELAQIENGVGLLASFVAQIPAVLEEVDPAWCRDLCCTLVTGQSAAPLLRHFVQLFNARGAARLQLVVIDNHFWGEQVTVAGLLTGQDIAAQLCGRLLGDALLLPDVLLREGSDQLLDDWTLADLEQQLGLPVHVVAPTPWAVLDLVEELHSDKGNL